MWDWPCLLFPLPCLPPSLEGEGLTGDVVWDWPCLLFPLPCLPPSLEGEGLTCDVVWDWPCLLFPLPCLPPSLEGEGDVDDGKINQDIVCLETDNVRNNNMEYIVHVRYLGQVTDNQCVMKICRSRSKHRSFFSANSLQSKFKVTIKRNNSCCSIIRENV